MNDCKYIPGDWVRFYRDGKFVTGKVEYVQKAPLHASHVWDLLTDVGKVSEDSVVEHRSEGGVREIPPYRAELYFEPDTGIYVLEYGDIKDPERSNKVSSKDSAYIYEKVKDINYDGYDVIIDAHALPNIEVTPCPKQPKSPKKQ